MSRLPKHHLPGIYRGLTFEQYAEIDAVNSTTLRDLRDGARECWYRRRFDRVVTDSMKAGSLAHIQVLDPQQYLRRVVEWKEPVLEDRPPLKWDKVHPGRYVSTAGGCECGYELVKVGTGWQPISRDGYDPETYDTITAAKAACKEHYERTTPRRPKLDADGNPKLKPQNKNDSAYQAFLAANPGRDPVTRKDLEAAKAIGMAVRDNPDAMEVLSGIWGTEVVVVWLDPDTGVKCKARQDWLTAPHDPHRVLLGDLKTCRDHAPPGFPRAAAGAEYHAQMAWYRTGLREAIRQLHGTSPEIRCVLLAVQSSGSHDSTVYDLGEDTELAAGDKLNAERLQQLLYYQDTYGERPWPGKCQRAPLNLAEHAPHVLGIEGNYGGLDLSGVERHGEED